VLKCLDKNWQPKVTAISESKDLSIITTTALFGKLREHEIEMQRLSELETSEKKVKPITLNRLVLRKVMKPRKRLLNLVTMRT